MYAIVMGIVHLVLSILPQGSKVRHADKVTLLGDVLVEYDGTIVFVLRVIKKCMLWMMPLAAVAFVLNMTDQSSHEEELIVDNENNDRRGNMPGLFFCPFLVN